MLINLLPALLLIAPQLGYHQAKALADKSEESLDSSTRIRLVNTQGKALSAAIKACVGDGITATDITVVLSLNADGSTAKSWLNNATPVGMCMLDKLTDAGLPGAWPTPFYTSFEMSFNSR